MKLVNNSQNWLKRDFARDENIKVPEIRDIARTVVNTEKRRPNAPQLWSFKRDQDRWKKTKKKCYRQMSSKVKVRRRFR